MGYGVKENVMTQTLVVFKVQYIIKMIKLLKSVKMLVIDNGLGKIIFLREWFNVSDGWCKIKPSLNNEIFKCYFCPTPFPNRNKGKRIEIIVYY